MAQSHVVSGLVAKRSELAGRIKTLQAELRELNDDVSTLDGAIKIIDPDYRLSDIRPRRTNRKNEFFKVHGEGLRFVLETLRDASEPISTTELADLASQRKDMQNPDMHALRATILSTLSIQRKKGVIAEVGRDDGGTIQWALAD